MRGNERYPALLVNWLTPAYDLFARVFIPERKLKRALIAQARLAPGQRVLDLGAGTGTLAIMLKRAQPVAAVNGVDADPAIVALARQKAARAGVVLSFEAGSALALPYARQSFDRVLSSLVFSLLGGDDKRAAILEAHRVLRPGGELHIADFGPPQTAWARRVAPLVRRFEPMAGNLDGRLPALLREAGFTSVASPAGIGSLFGTLSVLSGRKPG
jgi:ubiquinone/menaquinone biosynthesis C-methylase UbiE